VPASGSSAAERSFQVSCRGRRPYKRPDFVSSSEATSFALAKLQGRVWLGERRIDGRAQRCHFGVKGDFENDFEMRPDFFFCFLVPLWAAA